MSHSNNELITKIDAVLPQTQCGLCGYGGCKPYATAIVNDKETINLCPPGGVETLYQLATLAQQNAEPYVKEMLTKAKPPLVAVIREDECIGCTKCIQACPVDAIMGAAKQMHTVIADECTGCELCVKPCPVDCIDLIILNERSSTEKQQQADLARKRFYARANRLEQLKLEKKKKHEQAKLVTTATANNQTIAARRAEIAAAIARAKAKKK